MSKPQFRNAVLRKSMKLAMAALLCLPLVAFHADNPKPTTAPKPAAKPAAPAKPAGAAKATTDNRKKTPDPPTTDNRKKTPDPPTTDNRKKTPDPPTTDNRKKTPDPPTTDNRKKTPDPPTTDNRKKTPDPPAPQRFDPPRDAKATSDGKGGTIHTSPRGVIHTGTHGELRSVETRGANANFDSRGRLGTIRTKDGMTIQHGPNGERKAETIRPDGTRIVTEGHGRGFVEHPFEHGGHSFIGRTEVIHGRASSVHVYRRILYGGHPYYHYVPAYYYRPAFYGWAYNPWRAQVRWGWGWERAGWYGYYGAYFGPARFYLAPSFWLADYLIAANLQAAYDAQVGMPPVGGGPIVTVPGNQGWTDTGRYLNGGDEVTITASGAVSMGAGWVPLPPAGKGPNCGGRGGFPDGGVPCWSLIGRVGDGPIFYVGNGSTIQAPNSGELLLGVNDNILGDNTGNWVASISRPSSNGPGGAGEPNPAGNAAELTPEVKEAIASEVKMRIAAENDAANPTATSAASDNQIPAALDPKHSVFVVSSTLSEQTDDGQSCSLTGGDIVTRISNSPDANQKVRVLVTAAKKSDCPTGTEFAMAIQDLQDMYNDFQAKTDEGLKQLAANQGKNGMPSGPAPGGHANPDAAGAAADQTAAATLRQQDQNANNSEGEVNQAMHAPGDGSSAAVSADTPGGTTSVSKGQTTGQVIAILGQPRKTVDLGARRIYLYDDMKITFTGGKLSDVE
jgi:hypothetical protein